ncbi:MAG: CADD family putative folate metabolism protein [Oligoflexia bacterium]|nr:CADD family putative folate metabolism protein [Oligoflexia bacterium]
MSFVKILKDTLSPYHLLKHPFYQMWMEGTLPKECLLNYAGQYYHHVSAFPRYISALHSLCENQQDRKILLENLNDEEGAEGMDPHPDLWMYFAEGLGLDKKEVKNAASCRSIQHLIDTFFSHCRGSYAKGLSALYSYEYQVPEVAETKIQGLKKHYGIQDKRTLLFFLVHKAADVEHRQAIEKLLEKLPEEQQKEALNSAVDIAKALWSFLTEMQPSPSVTV